MEELDSTHIQHLNKQPQLMKGYSPVWAGGGIYQILIIKLAAGVKMTLSDLDISFGMA
jgi:hypothetical protein